MLIIADLYNTHSLSEDHSLFQFNQEYFFYSEIVAALQKNIWHFTEIFSDNVEGRQGCELKIWKLRS